MWSTVHLSLSKSLRVAKLSYIYTMALWSLISPASRGIGFALARRVLQTTTTPVVATARKDIAKTRHELLEDLGVDEERLTVLKVDVLGKSIGRAGRRQH